MGSKKKYKLIALVSAGALATTSLAAVVPIAIIKSQASDQKDKPTKPTDSKVKAAPKEAFQWDESGKVIKGFKAGATKEYIESLIDDQGRLGIPACDEIAYKAFSYAFESVTKTCTICFESSIKVIGENAFFGNEVITGFNFVTSEGVVTETTLLESIGKCAFEKTGVTKIVIPETCNTIGERAFYQCNNLAEINLATRSRLLKNVGSHAFQELAPSGKLVVGSKMSTETANAIAANLSTHEWGGIQFGTNWTIEKNGSPVALNKTIPTIYLNITDQYKLKSGIKTGKLSDYNALYIPSEVKEIEAAAFSENKDLTVLSFENNSQCEIIGELAFYSCTNLCSKNENQGLVMPEALTTIGRHAFTYCNNIHKLDLSKIVFDNRTRTFGVGIDAFYGWWEDPVRDPNKYVAPTVPEGTEEKVKENIESTFKYALSVHGGLNETWIILDTKPMSDNEFMERAKLKVTPVVGDETYEYHLYSFDWNGVEEEGFNTLKIPKGITVIDSTAFWDEETQTTKIPDTIKTIDMSKSDIKEIGANAFRQSNIQTVIFSDSTEKIGENAFQDCKKLNGVALPASLQSIGANAFKGCDNAYYLDLSKLTNDQLKEIIRKQNEGEKVIGDNAFQDFGILQEAGGTIIWPADVTEEVKNGITNILLGTGLPETWVQEESGKSGYTGGIPEKYNGNQILVIEHDEVADKYILKSINWSALEEYVSDLEEKTGVAVTSLPLIIPAHVSDIADDFWGNPTSSKLSIVDKLYFANNSKCKTIGKSAFKGATNFKGDLNIPTGVETIGASAFEGCTGFNGILTLPNTLSTSNGVNATAFSGAASFTTLNVSSWDDTYIRTWNTLADRYPWGADVLKDFSKDTFVQINDNINSSLMPKLKSALVYAGLGSDVLGEDVSTYTSKVAPMTLTLEDDDKVIDSAEKKQKVAEKYIEIINEGYGDYTGIEILTNDLMLTFKNAAVNSPALASANPSINVRLSNVDVSGESISFDIVANINVYSETYRYGYASQFATQVKDLKIVSADQHPSYDVNQTDKQIGIVFATDESTVFTTSYDKQYVYGYTEDGAYFKKNAIDITNKSFEFKNLDGKFLPNTPIDGKTTAASNLYEASRQAYLSAPSLFGLIFGAYDYSLIYNLNNGCDENGYLYSPYIKTNVIGEGKTSKMNMTYTPLSGMLVSNALSNYNVYGERTDALTNNTIWTTNIYNFNNTQLEAEEITTEAAALPAYKSYLTTETGSYTQELGQRFKEDVLYGFINPIKKQIETIIAAGNYKFVEESTVEFTKLNGLDVITTDGDGNVYANFGLNIKVYLHDASFVENGVDQEGNTVSSYKHSYELYIPLEFKNIYLNRAYKSYGTYGVNWSIFDNADASRGSYMIVGTTRSGMGPYVQELTYNEETRKFVRNLTFEPNPGKYECNKIYNDIKDMTTTTQIDAYMAQKWPLLKVLNILHSDYDGSKLHISFGYESKYLKKSSW